MNWDAVGAIAQIVGVIVVVVTVMYLAVQTRQNTRAVQASVRQGMLAEDCELLFKQMDFPFTHITLIGRRELSEDELVQLTTWIMVLMRTRENYWLQYRSGNIDEATWQTYQKPLEGLLLMDIGRTIWGHFSAIGLFNASFVKGMDQHMAGVAPRGEPLTVRELVGLD